MADPINRINSTGEHDMATTLEIGQTIEQGSIRIHRYNDSLVVTDLTNAGKRGKVCRRLWIQLGYGCTAPNLDGFARVAVCCETLDQFRASVSDVLVDFPDACRVDEKNMRAINVAPAGYTCTFVTGEFAIESEYDDFITPRRQACSSLAGGCARQGPGDVLSRGCRGAERRGGSFAHLLRDGLK